MSSKAKKTVTTTTTSSTSTSTQQRSSSAKRSVTPTNAEKSRTSAGSSSQQKTSITSQLSPTRYSRLHEKEELANLNDRLACYIERVRNLETENSRLTREIKTSQENVTREVTSVKTMYEKELSDARRALDDISKEKAKLEIDARYLFDDNEQLRSNVEKKSKECSILQTTLALKESQLTDTANKYNASQQERKKLLDENKNLEEERNKLAACIPDLRKTLESETLTRVELENTLQTVRDELAFKEQVHQQQLMESRTQKHVQEITEIDGRLIEEYEERLCQSLQDIRNQYEIDLECNRDEIKQLYEDKVNSLASQLGRNSSAASMALDEMKQMQQRMDDINRKLSEAEADKNFSNQRARDLEKQLERLKGQYMEEFAKHDLETTRLREEMAHQVQEYQGLMDIKVALDLEISAYRKLIEGEEARLKIPTAPSPSGRSTPLRAGTSRPVKRKRMYVNETEESSASNYSINSLAKGDIELNEIDLDGKYVRLLNKGNKEILISGWQLVRKAGEAVTSFKFHRSVKIEPGTSVTVWSADVTDQLHEPPENIVMKGQKWFVADTMTTSLVNSSGEEVAVVEHSKQQSSSSSSSISRQRGDIRMGGGGGGSSQLSMGSYFQRRTPHERVRYSSQSPDMVTGEERCGIM